MPGEDTRPTRGSFCERVGRVPSPGNRWQSHNCWLRDPEMSRRRSASLAGLTVLEVGESARNLARELLAENLLPPAAASDATHAAVSLLLGVSILLTWNCRHLAKPASAGQTAEIHGAPRADPAEGLPADRAYGRMKL